MSDYKKLQNGSDIRGVSLKGVPGEDVNLGAKEARNIGFAFAEFLKSKGLNGSVAIGRDPRLTGQMLAKHLEKGIVYGGMRVDNYGLSTTPAMFMSTVFAETSCVGAIMITASHLPYNRNGFKFFTSEGGLNKEDITDILKIAESCCECNSDLEFCENDKHIVESESASNGENINSCINESNKLMQLYCNHLKNIIIEGCAEGKLPLHDLTIAVDAGNGSGGFYANNVLAPLGAKIYGKYLEPDGNFPNHLPNPENKEAMASISKAVIDSNADLGLIFDTDCDRASAVDETGKEIARNGIVALAAALISEKHPATTVVTDSITSPELTKFLEHELGLKHLRFKRGYKNVINKAIELNAEGTESHLAIETSGHAAIKDNYFLDDGAYLATLIVIKTAKLKKSGKTIGSVLANLEEPAETLEVRMNISGEDFAKTGDKVLAELQKWVKNSRNMTLVTPNYEGVRVDFEDGETKGWFLLRKSLHDPILPLNIESSSIGGVQKILGELKPFLCAFTNLDTSKL